MYEFNFPPQTPAATFKPIIELKDQDTGELIDLSDIDITFEIRDLSGCCRLSATKDSGVVIIDIGYFQPFFANLLPLCEGTYRIHSTLYRDGTTCDFAHGSLPLVQP